MKRLETFEELLALPYGTNFSEVKHGQVQFYCSAGPNPKLKTAGLMAVSSAKYTDVKTYTKYNFTEGQFFTGEYSAGELGKAMLSQLEEEIKSVKEVYFNEIVA